MVLSQHMPENAIFKIITSFSLLLVYVFQNHGIYCVFPRHHPKHRNLPGGTKCVHEHGE